MGRRWPSSPGQPGSSLRHPAPGSGRREHRDDGSQRAHRRREAPRRCRNEEQHVTTTLERRTDQGGLVPGRKAPPRRRRSWFAREPAWPLIALLVGWPLWWALGLVSYIFVLLAIPM